MSQTSYAHFYPLVRSGGLFLLVIGFALVLGSYWFRFRFHLIAIGGAAAATVTALTAVSITRPYGVPSVSQAMWLTAAVLLEAVLLVLATHRYRRGGDRALALAILTVVGVHFLPMTLAFGPLAAVLAVLCTANVLAAARFSGYSLRAVWGVDGGIKTVLGALMWLAPAFGLVHNAVV